MPTLLAACSRVSLSRTSLPVHVLLFQVLKPSKNERRFARSVADLLGVREHLARDVLAAPRLELLTRKVQRAMSVRARL